MSMSAEDTIKAAYYLMEKHAYDSRYGGTDDMEREQLYAASVTALERRMAAKPILKDSLMNGACKIETYGCPTCGNTVKGVSVHCVVKYCPECGQRILWANVRNV